MVAPFHALNVTGPWPGQKACLVEAFGARPVAMIFARGISEPLTKLLRDINVATAGKKKTRSCAVFLTDDDDAETNVKTLAERQEITKCVLCVDNPSGPRSFHLAKKADITVILYVRHKVQANFTFRKGELDGESVGRVVAEWNTLSPE
jgi:hypothetical protein